MVVQLLAFILLLFVSPAYGQFWEWTPTGEHHKSTVLVTCGNRTGSGAYVTVNGTEGVLTCGHIFTGDRDATVSFSDGTKQQGRWTYDKYGYDLGWVFVTHPTIKPLTLAEQPPAPGERVEFVTHGGPRGDQRHWVAITTDNVEEKTHWFNTYVVSGDSGGTILNKRQQIVGVQTVGSRTAGYFTDDRGTQWPILKDGGSPPFNALTGFCRRVCPPRFNNNNNGPGIGVDGVYPPNQQQPQPPQQQPPPEITVEVDYGKLAELVIAKMKENPDPFRGTAGIDGKNGINGKDGLPGQDATVDYGQLATEVQKRLPPLQVVREAGTGGKQIVENIPVGGTLRLPPVRMEIQHPGGEVYFQEQPLGGIIAIKLIPKGQ